MKKDIIIDVTQGLSWAALCVMPSLISLVVVGSLPEALTVLKVTFRTLLPLILIYSFIFSRQIEKGYRSCCIRAAGGRGGSTG